MASRWIYLPRLIALLVGLGARDLLLIVVLSLVGGLAPTLSLIALQRLVDAAVSVAGGTAPVSDAALWIGVLFVLNVGQGCLGFWSSYLEDVEQRLKAGAE